MANQLSKLIKAASGKLIEEWDQSGDGLVSDLWKGDDKLDTKDLQSGIERLLMARFINSTAFQATSDPVELARLAMAGIKLFAQSVNSSNQPGVLNRPLLGRLFDRFKSCNTRVGDGDELDVTSAARILNDGSPQSVIFYHIDSSFKNLPILDGQPIENLIATGLQLWVQYTTTAIRAVEEAKDANVIVEYGHIDGAGNTLGLAHVGGPKLMTQLRLTMDNSESWTAKKFLAAICHEWGHILGLEHTGTGRQLMNSTLDPTGAIDEPQQEDIRLVQEKWGRATGLPAGIISASDDFPGKIHVKKLLQLN